MEKVLLEELNPEQLEAVTSTEGPLLIIAGAGTGKTRVVTRRIAYLLESKPDLKPENILALTYTNKAADEMRERVEELTGLETGDMFVGTIHSFCNQVLDEAGAHIGLPKLRQISEIEQWIFLEDRLEKLGLDYYMTLSNPRGVLKDFVRFVSRCKDGMVLPQDYAGYAAALRDDFEPVKEGLDEDDRKARELEVKREEELARVYQIYQDELLKAGLRDFGDSIIYTIKLFKERPNVLQSYREQFKYILIDEFQDTNLAQIEIFSLLASRHRNICVCGDSDQAIYRFRGASYASFNHFMERFPEAKKIRLDKNYRSGKHILSAACRLIDNNGADRFEPAVLVAGDNGGEEVSVLVCPDYVDEARAVAEEILETYLSLPEDERHFSDFAVLYRAHSHKDEVVKELKARGIPFQVSGIGLFDRPETRDILAFLTLIDDYQDSIACTRILSSGLLDLPPKDIMRVLHFAKEKEMLLARAIEGFDGIDGLSSETCEKLSHLVDIFAKLEAAAVKENVLDFVFEMLRATKYLDILSATPFSAQAAKNIGIFCRFIENYVNEAIDKSLHGFMRYLERYREAGGNLDGDGLDADEDAVRLTTVHGAKGLEFPYVFVIGLSSRRFPTANKKDAISFPDALNKDFLPGKDFHVQEERRLCYVAMTRAQKKLYLCAIKKKGTNPSQFVKEIDARGKISGGKGASEDGTADYIIRWVDQKDDTLGDLNLYPQHIDNMAAEFTRDIIRTLSSLPAVVNNAEALSDVMVRSVDRVWSIARLAHLSNIQDPNYYEEALSELDSHWPGITEGLLSEQPVFISDIARKRIILNLKEKIRSAPIRTGLSFADDQKPLRLSFTQIDRYQRCPRQYYYAFVLNIPARPAPAPSFGTVIHDVLAGFYKVIGEGKPPSVDDLTALYEAKWSSSGYTSKLQEEEYKKRGYEQLRKFYELNAPDMKPALDLEASFKLKVGDDLVPGRIDRIDELDDGTVEIIDYKTGKPKDKKYADKDLQLGIYALASIREFGKIPSKLSFYYLETNEKVTTERTEEQLEAVEATIIECALNIRKKKFDPKPNINGHCKWCDFKLLCDVFEKK